MSCFGLVLGMTSLRPTPSVTAAPFLLANSASTVPLGSTPHPGGYPTAHSTPPQTPKLILSTVLVVFVHVGDHRATRQLVYMFCRIWLPCYFLQERRRVGRPHVNSNLTVTFDTAPCDQVSYYIPIELHFKSVTSSSQMVVCCI